MKESFKKIPAILQKQILIRLAGIGLGLVMIVLVLTYRGSIQFLLPGIVTAITFLFSAAGLYFRCTEGKYVVIRGKCEEVQRSSIPKRVKAVYIQCEGRSVKIIGQLHKLRDLRVGDTLEAYISDSAPVYEHDECYVITNILAIRKDHGA